MTQEEKDLLLKDLSARAQYRVKILVSKGVRINNNGKIKESDLVDTVYGVIFYNDEPRIVTPQNFSYLDRYGIKNFGGWSVEVVKPYLRPMSSMTKEEEKEYNKTVTLLGDFMFEQDEQFRPIQLYQSIPFEMYEFFNAHHFDWRGLIPMGLALQAKEGMYDD